MGPLAEHRAALERYDVIATPTSPTVAFPIGDKASDPLAMYACDVMTIPSCLAGLPGLDADADVDLPGASGVFEHAPSSASNCELWLRGGQSEWIKS